MRHLFLVFTLIIFSAVGFAADEPAVKKSYLEDIFIWKISDELKLTAKQEQQFTEISRNLNRKKTELNRKIQDSIQHFGETTTEEQLVAHKKLISDYNQVSIMEFEQIKKLLGNKKFVSYLKIKNDLTTKVKSILVGEKPADKKEPNVRLPSPRVIVEGAE